MHNANGEALLGAWKLTAAYTKIEETGERREMWSQGTLLFEASGRMVALLTGSGREAVDSEAGKAALYQSMLAYSGIVSVEAGQFVTQVDIASSPAWVGTAQTRHYALTGDVLSLWTAPMQHPALPGQTVTGYLEWVREG